jgi:PPM family protein phosphatase
MFTSRYEVFGATDTGCVRQNNEDTFLIDEAQGLCLLADGMGGAQAGEHASKLAVETVAEFVRSAATRSGEMLEASFQRANSAVREAAAADRSRHGMGTTLVGVLDLDDKLVVANVGDSRCYLFGGGALSQVTEDQTWAHEIGRHLGIDAVAMRTHPMRHVLTMAIGADAGLRVQIYTIPTPVAGSEILICSDGLHGVIREEKIIAGLNSGQSLEAQCHYLIDEARKAGGPDNITVVLLRKKPGA